MLTDIISRISKIEGDPTKQVVDLLLFFGYFLVCIYAGGTAYILSYNSIFDLNVINLQNEFSTGILFVNSVLLKNPIIFTSSLALILALIFLYYLCRYVFRPWFGYFLLSFLLYFTFISFGLLGKNLGLSEANNDKTVKFTSKPIITLDLQDGNNNFKSRTFHLLSENNEWFFIFEPMAPGSQVEIQAIKKESVSKYTVVTK